MKKLFIAALLFVGVVSFAQEADQVPNREPRERLTPEQRNEKQLKKNNYRIKFRCESASSGKTAISGPKC